MLLQQLVDVLRARRSRGKRRNRGCCKNRKKCLHSFSCEETLRKPRCYLIPAPPSRRRSAAISDTGSRQVTPRHTQALTRPGAAGLSRPAGSPPSAPSIATSTPCGRNSGASSSPGPQARRRAAEDDDLRRHEAFLERDRAARRIRPGSAASPGRTPRPRAAPRRGSAPPRSGARAARARTPRRRCPKASRCRAPASAGG